MDISLIKERVAKGDIKGVAALTEQALKEGRMPKDILDDALIKAMDEIGDRFKKNEIFIPEVMIAAKAMHAGLAVLEPLLAASGVKPVAKIAIGTVKGDLHDIGKNLVAMMLRGAGFEVMDLGIDVPSARFIDAVKRDGAEIVAMSSLVTTSTKSMKDVIAELRAMGGDGACKTLIGGAPVTQEFADSIGADGYAGDASGAVDKARELLGLRIGA